MKLSVEWLLAIFTKWLMTRLVFKKEVVASGAKVDVKRLSKKEDGNCKGLAKDLRGWSKVGLEDGRNTI